MAVVEEAAIAALLYPSRDSDEWRALLDAVPGVLVRAACPLYDPASQWKLRVTYEPE